jgi:PAS domain S-box-containing protein
MEGAEMGFGDVKQLRPSRTPRPVIDQHTSALLAALPMAVYTTDAAGQITFYNEAAAELWGVRAELGSAKWCGSWRLYWPDGRPMPHGECPMGVALKEQRAIYGAEAVAEKPDGTRITFLAYPTPLWDDAGTLTGAVNTLIDITDRKHRGEAAQRLASIVESSQDAIVSKDLNGIITSWNGGAERLFGYTAAEVIGKSVTILIPEDHIDEEPMILERIRRGDRVDHYETVRRRKDGSLVDISLTISPVTDDAGRVIGASKIARDITERKRAQERQQLLLREMNHRTKNLFALASGIVALSTRSASDVDGFAEAVQARLTALARAHELTLPTQSAVEAVARTTTTLRVLLQTIVEPFDGDDIDSSKRVVLSGPDIPVGGSGATSLALLLHEFAANAAKYGALSSATGQVEVDWLLEGGELRLRWKESGGPRLKGMPATEGFGSVLARATVGSQLKGHLSRDWSQDGLTIHLTVSADRLTA